MFTFILGTRPEIIKTAPLMHEFKQRSIPFTIVHTGQHYTPTLDDIFFEELSLPTPITNLRVGSLAPVHQVAQMMMGIAEALVELNPRAIIIQGDTNSVLAGALAAHKLAIPIAHLEAGLRSDDWTMPEEGNRILAGRVATIHFCPTNLQRQRLAAEGITQNVYVIGNTAVDACLRFSEIAQLKSTLLEQLGLKTRSFAMLTMHRPSNVDNVQRLESLLLGLSSVARSLGLTLVFPIHPRTQASLRMLNLEHYISSPEFCPIEPIGYLDMLALMQKSQLVFTDSGGAQEEACTLHIPCITLRPNTERPETVHVGANILCDSTEANELLLKATQMIQRPRTWLNPFGNGQSSAQAADILESLYPNQSVK